MEPLSGSETISHKPEALRPGNKLEVKYLPAWGKAIQLIFISGLPETSDDQENPPIRLVRKPDAQAKVDEQMQQKTGEKKARIDEAREWNKQRHDRALDSVKRDSFYHDGGMHEPEVHYQSTSPEWVSPHAAPGIKTVLEVVHFDPDHITVKYVSGPVFVQPGCKSPYESVQRTAIEDIDTINGKPAREVIKTGIFTLKRQDLAFFRKKGLFG